MECDYDNLKSVTVHVGEWDSCFTLLYKVCYNNYEWNMKLHMYAHEIVSLHSYTAQKGYGNVFF